MFGRLEKRMRLPITYTVDLLKGIGLYVSIFAVSRPNYFITSHR